MRSTYLFIFLLLSVAVLAQDVTISLAKEEITQVDFAATLGPDGAPSVVYDLPADTVLSQLKVYDVACARNCGSAKLCVSFDASPKDCKPVDTTASWIGPFTTVPRIVHKIELSYEGLGPVGFCIFCPDRIMGVSKLELAGGDAVTITRGLLSFRGGAPISLGTVSNLIGVAGFTGNTLVTSSDPRGVSWFDESGSVDISATSRRITSNFDDEVLICSDMDQQVDADGNPVCDYKKQSQCTDVSQGWYKGKCCGAVPYTSCAYYDDIKAYCGRENSFQTHWAALDEIGLIVNLADCPGLQIVSDGTSFYTCVPPPAGIPNTQKISGRLVIQGHEYACDSLNNIVECGGPAVYSPFNGKLAGSSAIIDGKKQYCAVDGTWMISLSDYASCTAADFVWTGTKCCGEADDPEKTYEDPFVPGVPGSAGGCFKGQFVPSGGFVGNDPRIMNARGHFVVCDGTAVVGSSVQQGVAPAPFTDTGVSPFIYGPCGNPLADVKLTGTANNAVCSPYSEWQFTLAEDSTVVKSAIWQTAKGKGCCPENQCWDGARCRDIGEYHTVNDRGFRCQ